MLNSVAGTPTARGGKLARAARMWWTPDQGGLQPQYRMTSEAERIPVLEEQVRSLIERVKDLEARSAKPAMPIA